MLRARSSFLTTVGCVLWLGLAPAAHAYSTGSITTWFPDQATGCNNAACHSGGTTPTVTVSGPTAVAPGSTNTYTVTVSNPGLQKAAGLNVSAPLGQLAIGGPDAANTKTVLNGALDEVTHTAPKLGTAGLTTFSFDWTAPALFSSAGLNVWGNAVDLGLTSLGDAAAKSTLSVSNNTLCPAVPRSCIAPLKSVLTITSKVTTTSTKQTINFAWRKGPTTAVSDFSTPTANTPYALCLYVDSNLLAQMGVPAGLAWTANPKGFRYKDKTAPQLQAMSLAIGTSPDKAVITTKGKNTSLGLPTMLPAPTTSIIVQVANGENGMCWGEQYSGLAITKIAVDKLVAKH